MVPKSTNMTSSSRCSQQQQDPSLLSLPLDALGYIMTILEPRDVCSFACAAHHTAILSHARRKSVLLARSCGKVHLRLVRYRMQARSTFVAHYCQLEHLADRETCQGRLLKSLKSSPDPIPDLAAATQAGLLLISSQTHLHQSLVTPLRSDLVRCANFVCLLAWKQHLQSRRRAAAAAASTVPDLQLTEHSQGHTGDMSAAHTHGHSNFQPANLLSHVPNSRQVVNTAAVQTEMGPSLQELQQLLTGFSTLMTSPDNPSTRLVLPSLNLLCHLLDHQLQAWNLPGPDPQQQQQQMFGAGADNDGGEGGVAGNQQNAAVGWPHDESDSDEDDAPSDG